MINNDEYTAADGFLMAIPDCCIIFNATVTFI
jgi:hypothetical protein